MLLRLALILALVAAAGYGVWEIRRWSLPETLITTKQKHLRLWGLLFLLAVLGLWLHGTALPTPHSKQALIGWIQYWMLTVVLSLPLIPLALLDWRENLKLLADARRRVFDETLAPLTPHQDPPA